TDPELLSETRADRRACRARGRPGHGVGPPVALRRSPSRGRGLLQGDPVPGAAAAMNFSEVFKLSGLLSKFSPDGKYLASCVQYRLAVREVSTLQILQLYTCLDQIQHIEWSADSLFILCAMYKRGLVQVWSLEQPDWHCKIDEGSAGLVASCWSPDGRHILNTTEFHGGGEPITTPAHGRLPRGTDQRSSPSTPLFCMFREFVIMATHNSQTVLTALRATRNVRKLPQGRTIKHEGWDQ
ncbi:uncharacterized protein LOC101655117, partial [Echinops telfairi]|uniref:Uncharacterized protein LOC101655117 n=1 Tax=Echinops telfairi TaxID=9371 RepID=A0ABM0J9L7_ECHTE